MSTYTWTTGTTWVPNPPTAAVPGDTLLISANSTIGTNGIAAGSTLDNFIINVGSGASVTYSAVTAQSNTVTIGPNVVWNIGTGTIGTGTIAGSTITGDVDTFGTGDTLNFSGSVTINNGTTTVVSSTLNGGTLTFGANDLVSFTDSTIDTSNLTFANGDTLTLTGNSATSMVIDPHSGGPGSSTQISESGSNDLLTISSLGTVSSNAFTWIKNGTTASLNIQQNGSAGGGLYYMQGPLLVTGGTLAINAGSINAGTITNPGSGVFANAGFLVDWGGSQPSLVTITGSMDSAGGMMEILGTGTGSADGATLELATNTSGSQAIVFGDGDGTLRIDATDTIQGSGLVLANTKARILGFQTGDTIDLAGLAPTGSPLIFSYGTDATYGTGVLEVHQNGTLIGALRFSGTNFVAGTGTLTNGGSSAVVGNFVLSQSGTDVLLTLQAAGTISGSVAIWNAGTSGNWNSASGWIGGALPGAYETAEFVITAAEAEAIQGGSFPQYLVTVGGAETAGAVVFADPLGTLDIAGSLTLDALGSLSGGGSFQQTQGTVDILSGGTLTATSYYQVGDTLLVQSGGTMMLSGSASFTAPLGLSGLDVENKATIAGGTVRSSGNILIGEKNDGQLDVTSGSRVTGSFTNVGGATFANPEGGMAALDISGPNTQWTDAGGDSSTPYSGAMLVGGGYPGMNASFQVSVSNGGSGALSVTQGATLTDASYAMLGLTPTSIGWGTISNGAVWQVNNGGTLPGSIVLGTTTLTSKPPPLLTVGALGSGYLTIDSRGTVTLGTTASGSGWAMSIGQGGTSNPSAAFGMVVVDGQGSVLNTGGGPLAIGNRGSGVLNVTNGGSVSVGNGGTAQYGAVLGNNYTVNSGGTTILSSGSLSVDGTINAGTIVSSTFSVGSGNLMIGGGGNGAVSVGAGGTVSVAAGSIVLANGGNGPGAGSLNVSGGTVLGSALNQNGSLSFGTAININGNFLFGNGGTSVWVNGVVALSQEIFGSTTLNAGFGLNSGTANIGGGGTLVLDNTGIVSLFGGSTLDLMGGGTGANAALLQVGTSDGGGQIFIGTSGMGPALLFVSSNATVEAGTIALGSAGTLNVAGGSVEAIQLNAGASPGFPSISIGSGGEVALTDSGTLVASLDIDSGTASINNGSLSIDKFGTATIGGGATLSINGPGVLQFTSAGVGTTGYALTIGDPNGNGLVSMQNDGALIDTAGGNISVGQGGSGGASGSGTLSVGSGATVSTGGGSAVVGNFGAGTLSVGGAGGALFNAGTGNIEVGLGNSGTLAIQQGGTVAANNIWLNGVPATPPEGGSGTLLVTSGLVLATSIQALGTQSMPGASQISVGGGSSNALVSLTAAGTLALTFVVDSGNAQISAGGTVALDYTDLVDVGGGASLTVMGSGTGLSPALLRMAPGDVPGTNLFLGDANGNGSMLVEYNGATVNTGGGGISVGQSGTGTASFGGTLTVTSGGTMDVGGVSVIGNFGYGTLVVGGAGPSALFNDQTGTLVVGVNNRGLVALQSGGTLTAVAVDLNGGAGISPGTGAGTLSVGSGGVLQATQLFAVYNAFGSGSVIDINGGTVNLVGSSLMVPNFIVDSGSATIGGGGTVSLGSHAALSVGGGGTLSVMSGSAVLLGAGSYGTSFTIGDPYGTGNVLVEGIGATIGTGGGGIGIGSMTPGPANSGTLTVTSGGTVSAGGVSVLGEFGAGTLVVGGSGPSAVFSQTGTLVVGVDYAGLVALQSGGTLTAAAIDLNGGAGISPGTGTGTLVVGQGGFVQATELSIAYNPGVSNQYIEISNGGSVALVAAGTLAAGLNLDGGSTQISSDSTLSLDNTGTAVIGGDSSVHLNAGVLQFGTGYTGSSYRLALGDASGGGWVTVQSYASIDAAGPIDIGQSNWGTLSIGQTSTVTASAVSGVPWAAVVGDDGAGMLNLGGAWGPGALFSTQGALVVGLNNDGTVLVEQGGTVSVGGELDVGGSPVAASSNGTGWVTIDGGGTVGGADLMVSGSIVVGASTLSGSNIIVVQNGGSLNALGTAWLGYGTSASGTLSIASDGAAQLGGLSLWLGSEVTLDSTGELLLGNGAPITSGQIGIGSDATLDGAGMVSAASGVVDDGVIAAAAPPVAIPGVDYVLTIGGPVSGSGLLDVGSHSTLDLSSVASSDTIAFTGTADVLALQSPASVAATIHTFWVGSTIDLAVADNDLQWNWDQGPTGGTLTVFPEGDAPVATLSISGEHNQDTGFTLEDDGHGGTYVLANDAGPCFAAGTRIATTRGEVAVEALAVGDAVRLAGGGTAPVVWLGHRSVACARHPRPQDIMPVRVSAHAFGAGQPARELVLSPDHAVFIDGVLIPVRYLLNGATIVQEQAARVSYWHVELEHHDVLLAEGLACESYLDTGNRGAFANGGGAMMMHPDFALRVWERASCARLVTDGAELEAARSFLLDRAHQLGFTLTDEPDLHLVVNGRRLGPEAAGGGVHRFVLPGDAAEVVIVSRAAVPQETHDIHPDGRRLGVMLRGIRFSQHGQVRDVGLAALPDGDGFHALEQDGGQCWRWTNGQARLGVPAGFAAGTALGLELEVGASVSAWLAPETTALRRTWAA